MKDNTGLKAISQQCYGGYRAHPFHEDIPKKLFLIVDMSIAVVGENLINVEK